MTDIKGEPRPRAAELEPEPRGYPTSEESMKQKPDWDMSSYRPSGKLSGKTALITGGDSGIGRAVALAFAMEGADVAIVYHSNSKDAQDVGKAVEAQERKFLQIQADVASTKECRRVVQLVKNEFGSLNVLVNNAAYQMSFEKFEDIPEDSIHRTIDTNLKGYIFMAQAALPLLGKGDSIINTSSVVSLKGNPVLIDYASTKGAINLFTKSLANHLGSRQIRVNAVLPGPIWTPLIEGTLPKDSLKSFGEKTSLGRPGQPEELAPAYVYFASHDSSYCTGSLLEVTGGW